MICLIEAAIAIIIVCWVVILPSNRSVDSYFSWSISLCWCGSRSKHFSIREIIYSFFSVKRARWCSGVSVSIVIVIIAVCHAIVAIIIVILMIVVICIAGNIASITMVACSTCDAVVFGKGVIGSNFG